MRYVSMPRVLNLHDLIEPVADLSVGTGSWIIQAAMTWPVSLLVECMICDVILIILMLKQHTVFTGVDIVPIQPDLSIGEPTKTMAERIHWIKADM
jgi:hypothetical protein